MSARPVFDDQMLMRYESIKLDLRKYAATMGIGETFRQNIEVAQYDDLAARKLMLHISSTVLANRIADDKYEAVYSYKVFASWWQHFKHDHTPKWFVKKFPIKYDDRTGSVEVKFERWATYPKANVAIQRHQKFYEVRLGGFEVLQDEITQIRRVDGR